MFLLHVLLDIVIGGADELLAQLALLLYTRVHIIVNVDRGILLFLEAHVMNLDLAGLAEAQHTPRGLVHQRRRPPRRGKDDAVHMLEIEASSSALNLRQNDRVARADEVLNYAAAVQGQKLSLRERRLKSRVNCAALILICCCLEAIRFRRRDDCVALLGRHLAVVGIDVGNAAFLLEALLQKGIPTALKMYAGEQVSLNSALIER